MRKPRDCKTPNIQHARNKIAKRLNDQTLKQIRLYDIRHYFGTSTYDKTRT